MAKTFGKASDFYRARIITLDEETPPDFDWREDILFREPPGERRAIKRNYTVQIVDLDTRDDQVIMEYPNRNNAESVLRKIEEDLRDLTKMEFERKYELHIREDTELDEEAFQVKNEEATKEDQNTDAPRNLS